ncbi:hypothetical protein ACILG0_23115 [Pseudomonadota bacterium AL_CKDN230030165-1A_HGKHYDSX7]
MPVLMTVVVALFYAGLAVIWSLGAGVGPDTYISSNRPSLAWCLLVLLGAAVPGLLLHLAFNRAAREAARIEAELDLLGPRISAL